MKPTAGRWGTGRRIALAVASAAVMAVVGLAVNPTPAAAQLGDCAHNTGKNGAANQQYTSQKTQSNNCYRLGARHRWYVQTIGMTGWTSWVYATGFPGAVLGQTRATYSYGQGLGSTR